MKKCVMGLANSRLPKSVRDVYRHFPQSPSTTTDREPWTCAAWALFCALRGPQNSQQLNVLDSRDDRAVRIPGPSSRFGVGRLRFCTPPTHPSNGAVPKGLPRSPPCCVRAINFSSAPDVVRGRCDSRKGDDRPDDAGVRSGQGRRSHHCAWDESDRGGRHRSAGYGTGARG